MNVALVVVEGAVGLLHKQSALLREIIVFFFSGSLRVHWIIQGSYLPKMVLKI